MRCVISGIGKYAEVYYQMIRDYEDIDIVGFTVDDEYRNKEKSLFGIPIYGETLDFESLSRNNVEGVIAPIGDNNKRVEILSKAEKYGLLTPSVIHKTCNIEGKVDIKSGVYIFQSTSIMPYVKINKYVMISQGVNIAHHTIIGTGAFISMGSNIGAKLKIGSKSFIGIGSTVMTGVDEVGANSLVGAGAVVIDNVCDGETVVGVPAKPIN